MRKRFSGTGGMSETERFEKYKQHLRTIAMERQAKRRYECRQSELASARNSGNARGSGGGEPSEPDDLDESCAPTPQPPSSSSSHSTRPAELSVTALCTTWNGRVADASADRSRSIPNAPCTSPQYSFSTPGRESSSPYQQSAIVTPDGIAWNPSATCEDGGDPSFCQMISRYGFGLTSADVEQFGLDFNSEATQQLLQQLLEELQNERQAEEAAAAEGAIGASQQGGVIVTEEEEEVAMGVPTADELAYWNYLMAGPAPVTRQVYQPPHVQPSSHFPPASSGNQEASLEAE
jgi:hypothetical protein